MATKSPKAATLEDRLIEKLAPHPRNAELFSDLSPAEMTQLIQDIADNGLRTPIEILSNGTILTGHQRVKACRALEHKKIRCVVRHDLVDATPAVVEKLLIRDNLVRRQLSEIAVAR